MSRLHAPLTLPKHGELLNEINQTIIDIKIHNDDSVPNKLRIIHTKHSWEDITNLLRKCYNAINEQRESPIKY